MSSDLNLDALGIIAGNGRYPVLLADAAMERGGRLGKGDVVLVKVSKPNQDFRFDVPVIGTRTMEHARDSNVKVIACEARRTLLLDRKLVLEQAARWRITLFAADESLLKE